MLLIHQSLSLPAEEQAMFGSPSFDIPRLSIGLTPHIPSLSLPPKLVSPCSLFANRNARGADLGNTKCDLKKVWNRNSLISAGGIVFFRGRWAVLGCCYRMWLCQVQNLWGELPVLSLLSPSSSGGKTNCSRGIQSCHRNCSLKDTGAGAAAAK